MHTKYVTTGWHYNPKVGLCSSNLSFYCASGKRVEDAVRTCVSNFVLQVDAEQYYSELEEKRTDEFNAEKNRISMKRLGIAFVTFHDERMTAV